MILSVLSFIKEEIFIIYRNPLNGGFIWIPAGAFHEDINHTLAYHYHYGPGLKINSGVGPAFAPPSQSLSHHN